MDDAAPIRAPETRAAVAATAPPEPDAAATAAPARERRPQALPVTLSGGALLGVHL